jgi:glycerol uptake facilitator-like aquaporin
MNPAISIAMAVAVKITPLRALFYVLAQCVGAILGSLLLKWWVTLCSLVKLLFTIL